MPTTDPRIDDHIARAGAFAQPILERFRAVVHEVVPQCVETIKWGMPHFTLDGRNLAGMAAFKKHVSIFFHHDEAPGEDGAGAGTGRFRQISSLDAMPDDAALRAKLEAAIDRLASAPGKARPRAAPRPMPAMPEAFDAALDRQALRERFDALPPGYRREYIEWIAEAKTQPTRDRRIDHALALIAEGKHRNWKYQAPKA